ncbi:MAG: glyoxalase [Lachnospiraceae bacterium]|nr:glyoxalase [Lachnospiraceae bacterium]
MFDEEVVEAFLRQQGKLFDEPVAESPEAAEAFLEDVCAVVCENEEDVFEYLDEEMDVSGYLKEEILELEEVFPVGDGRYLIVEG